MIQRITANLVGAQTRKQMLDGKEYLVVPTVMLTEGVHTGSQGPLYYSKDQLGRNPSTWNHKPVVLYHPVDGISACTPDVISAQGVGMMLNSSYDGRLKTESWLDEPKLRKLDSRVLDAINRGETVEVSTGLWNDLDEKPGVWNGETYKGSVINIQPDHLALLPDQKGACSREDGAGLLRNASGDLSLDDAREQIRSLLKAKITDPMYYVYVVDVFRTYAIYESAGKVFKIGYTVKDNKVKLSNDEPEEVCKVTSYITANEAIIGGTNKMVFSLPYANQADMLSTNNGQATSQTTTETPMATAPAQNTIQTPAQIAADATVPPVVDPNNVAVTRKSAIDTMIAQGVAVEAERPELTQMAEGDFKAVHNHAMKKAQIKNVQQYLPLPVTNQQPAAVGVEGWLTASGAPPEIAELVRNSLARDEEEKTGLIQVIVANRNNKFNPEWLKQQKVVMLRGLAAIAGPTPTSNNLPNYSGQGEVPMLLPSQQHIQNVNAPQESLPLPRVFTESA